MAKERAWGGPTEVEDYPAYWNTRLYKASIIFITAFISWYVVATAVSALIHYL